VLVTGATTIEETTMQATDILMQEHRIIEQALAGLEGMAALAERERRLDGGHARQVVAFIRGYADKRHHAKEEDLLFVAMEAMGFSRQAGPLAVMLHEHEVGRALVGRMANAIEQASAGQPEALAAFADSAKQFASLLRGHIQKEDNILYPMADDALSPETQERLVTEFARAEEAQGGQAARDGFVTTAAQLADRYAQLSPHHGRPDAGGFGCGNLC
jgi:hemerythrin-like domain-containing protein